MSFDPMRQPPPWIMSTPAPLPGTGRYTSACRSRPPPVATTTFRSTATSGIDKDVPRSVEMDDLVA